MALPNRLDDPLYRKIVRKLTEGSVIIPPARQLGFARAKPTTNRGDDYVYWTAAAPHDGDPDQESGADDRAGAGDAKAEPQVAYTTAELTQALQASRAHQAVAQQLAFGLPIQGLAGGQNTNTLAQPHPQQFAPGMWVVPYTGGGQKEPSPSVDRAAPVVGEIIGWRAWNIGSGGLLHAITMGVPWYPGEPMRARSPESLDAGEGIHAYKSLRLAQSMIAPSPCRVFGSVEMWGEVIEHDCGYRAEFAAVRSLDVIIGEADAKRFSQVIWGPSYGPEDLKWLRNLYGVEGGE